MPLSSIQISPAAFADGRGLLFPGEFVISANIAMVLLYNSSLESAMICVSVKEWMAYM